MRNRPGVASESGMVKRVEAVVVGQGDVCVVVEQKGEHVVALFADRVVNRSIAFAVLQAVNSSFSCLRLNALELRRKIST